MVNDEQDRDDNTITTILCQDYTRLNKLSVLCPKKTMGI